MKSLRAMVVVVFLFAVGGVERIVSADEVSGVDSPAELVIAGSISDWQPESRIQSVEVVLTLGAGDDLSEPVAVDLGVGFPFWLHPLGRQAGVEIPFGAVAQRSTATGRSLAAGSKATFQFFLDRPRGDDPFDATRLLMRDLRISDLNRVGLSSPGKTNWVLDGLTVRINGKAWFDRQRIGESAQVTIERTKQKMAEARQRIDPDVLAVVQGMDRSQLLGHASLRPLRDLLPLEASFQARAPWFIGDTPQVAAKNRPEVKRVRVSVETFDHSLAETRNRIFFVAGGHKYRLDPASMLPGETPSTKSFTLDLAAGPLHVADMRGWGLGVVADPQIQLAAPDRWHPRRLVVEVDGQTVYDSDEIELDRRSLAAIRLMPAYRLDRQGQVVADPMGPREFSLWMAGQAQGLDLDSGGLLSLTATQDAELPVAESSSLAVIGPSAADWQTLGQSPEGVSPFARESIEPGVSNFFGSTSDAAVPGANASGGPLANLPSGKSGGQEIAPPASSASPGGLFPGETPPPAVNASGARPDEPAGPLGSKMVTPSDSGLLSSDVQPPPGSMPAGTPRTSSAGSPFQIDNARIVAGSQAGDTFVVTWQVSGDETGIVGYDVSLRAVEPDQVHPFAKVLTRQRDIRSSARSVSLDVKEAIPEKVRFVAAMVVAVTENSNDSTPAHQRISPARAVFADGTMTGREPTSPGATSEEQLRLSQRFAYTRPPTRMLGSGEVKIGGNPDRSGPAVWVPELAESHNAIEFASARPAWNLAMRPEAGQTLTARFVAPVVAGQQTFVAYAGFLGGSDSGNRASMELKTRVFPLGSQADPIESTQQFELVDRMGGSPQPLRLIEVPLELGSSAARVELAFNVRELADPKHPPTLFGARLFSKKKESLPMEQVSLHRRVVLIENDILEIHGSEGHDTIEIWLNGMAISGIGLIGNIKVSCYWDNKTPYGKDGTWVSQTFSAQKVKWIRCRAYGGKDYISLEGDGEFLKALGGSGDDRIRTYYSRWGHHLYGEQGNDALVGGMGNDRLDGGDGANWMNGQGGSDTLIGGKNTDVMYGGSGSDTLQGGGGNDVLHSGEKPYEGGSVVGSVGGSGQPALRPVDHLDGGDGDDTLYGDEGRGWFVMRGGKGNDKLMTFYFSAGHQFGGDDNDQLYGGVLDDVLYGGDGMDQLYGKDGEDRLYGHDGNDFLSGGPGVFKSAEGTDRLEGGPGNDLLVGHYGVDYLVAKSDKNYDGIDTRWNDVFADDTTDILDGGTGNDRIYGEQGDDTLYGREGDDYLYGGAGNDLLLGDKGLNLYASELSTTGGNDTMWGGKGTDHLYGHAGRDELHGGPGSDFLFGDYRRWSNAIDSDRLDGGAGFDTLGGDRGNDLLYGGKGKDHLYGHDGDDTLFSGMGPGDGTQGVMDLMEGSTGKDTFLIEQDPLTKLPINGQSDIATEIRDFQPAEGDVKKMLSVSDLKKLFDWVEKW